MKTEGSLSRLLAATRTFLGRSSVAAAAGVTLFSGIVNLWSLVGPFLPERLHIVRDVFPLDVIHAFRFAILWAGLFLVVTAVNIYRRKKRAWQLAAILVAASIPLHLAKSLDYEEALVQGMILVILLATRHQFTVKSSVPNLGRTLLRLVLVTAAAIVYGTLGFWVLEPEHFGLSLDTATSFHYALKQLTFMDTSDLVARSHYAAWFAQSLHLASLFVIVYVIAELYRPVAHRYLTAPADRHKATELLQQYGRSSLDYFKVWPDKSLFFSTSGKTVIAYAVGRNFAIALGDPVGPDNEIAGTTRDFISYCRSNGWDVGFHQTLPDFLEIYEQLGFRKFKLGDDAIVDLKAFSLDGHAGKEYRQIMRKMESLNVMTREFLPPVPAEIVLQAKGVSDSWLFIPGRRERTFTLGQFVDNYVSSTTMFAAFDEHGAMLAFANVIPSYHKGEVTIDLMRRHQDSPNGVMDYLFVKLFLLMKERGLERFNLGLAPMSGFADDEEASVEEKAIHFFFQHLEFLFSYRGLKAYKAKYAGIWEPRFAIYSDALSLPRMALALANVSEVKKHTVIGGLAWWEKQDAIL